MAEPRTSIDAARDALDARAVERVERVAGGQEVAGEVGGQPIRYREVGERSVIVAALPAAIHEVILVLFPEREFVRRQIEGGRQIDVIVGDRAFDAAFVIEAAPSDIVTELLDDRLRAWLLEHRPELFQIREHADETGDVHVELPRLRADAVAPALEIVAAFAAGLASRIRTIAERLELAARPPGQPYRSEPDAEAGAALRRARAAELQRLRDMTTVSGDASGYLVGLGIVSAVIAFLIALVK